ncbi:hypothetical protein [Streptomyces sp. 6N223]|uniref:hypothetical protein n=1 Tax=Streptomyces sp. 6N223 TaxID=3457412 RepID=UPI003FCFDC88
MTERDPERGEGRDPIDEEAAWAEIVAGYGDEPADPPGVWPRAEELDLTDTVDRTDGEDRAGDEAEQTDRLGPVNDADAVGGDLGEPLGPMAGPRDWEAAEDEDEGHFVPPEPPPLPQTDLTTKLAWVAVLGGPLLLIGAVLLQFEMTWWLATLGIGGFLGGFGTLVARMRNDDDDEWPDPGRGAVV